MTTLSSGPVQLHSDFSVNPAREQEFLSAYENFSKLVKNAAGFRHSRLLKIRPETAHDHGAGQHPAQIGKTPENLNYRLVQEWESEEARWKWNPTPDHHAAWHPLEKPLNRITPANLFTAYLFDIRGPA